MTAKVQRQTCPSWRREWSVLHSFDRRGIGGERRGSAEKWKIP